jgi:hypothetical protein
MRNARFLAVGLMLALLAPFPGSAQESPTVLTSREFRCQNAFGRSLVDLGVASGACLAECETTPGRRCSSFSTDPITADCLARAQADAQIPVLRDCSGSDCPECYSGGNCSSYTSSAFSQVDSLVGEAVQTIYCDDSFSRDGLTRAEQQCQRGLSRASGRFIEALLRCTANCEKAVQRGTTGFSSCAAAFVDTPTFDPKAQRCFDRARATLLKSCEGHCQDPPDCFDLTCSQTVALLEQEAAALQPVTYCQEPGICGDGQVTGAEVCDYSASPTGCGRGEQCSFGCSECFPVCGDGIIVPPEVCDPNASPTTGCLPGYQCSGCDECLPICGDGVLVSGEFCDQSAPQNGCPTGQVCEFCDFCEIPCGNGQLDPGEVCDQSSVGTCELGTACDATCDACNPTQSATEDVPGCNGSAFDTWTFQVTSGQNVVVRLDTDGFNGLELFVDCNGFFFSALGNLQCSNGSFGCAGIAFITGSDASCSATVEPVFCESGTIDYRLDVSGTNLTLVTDDGNPASPSGAFVDAPRVEIRPGA